VVEVGKKKVDPGEELRIVDFLPLSPWFKSQISDMEAVLQKAGLPRECWRDLTIDLGRLVAPQDEDDRRNKKPPDTGPDLPPEKALGVRRWCGKTTPPLVKFVHKHSEDDEARNVYFAAAIAAAANLALERWQNSEDRFLLGVCHERFWTLRKFDPDGAGRRAVSRFVSEAGFHGGKAGEGKTKRQHSDLMRRAVQALGDKKIDPSLGLVRDVLRLQWQTLAYEVGDPLREIVDVAVPKQGPIRIEYTAAWAAKRRPRTVFVDLDNDALKKAISRARTVTAI
jgi:hypothetical protein